MPDDPATHTGPIIQIFQVERPRTWLDRKQAARYCNMSTRQFDRERRAEPALQKLDGFSGKTPQWRPESLDRYLARHGAWVERSEYLKL